MTGFADQLEIFTCRDHVMAKVDDHGRVIGFSILKVTAVQPVPLDVAL